MKKFSKKDLINLLIITVIFIGAVLLIKGNRIYSSTMDNNSQHTVIPEYFRSLFYSSKDLFPSFAFNLGGGQNIYNYSYYGLFNPIIMLSYLFPFITMRFYVIYSTLFLIYSSIVLFYLFLRKKYDSNISFISSICFMCSVSLMFHTHRHIMFVNYMPFLILGLFGVDNYFENGNKKLLCISTLLLILMSYYYSVPSIIVLVVYGIYKYISINEKITFKNFIKDGFKFLIPIIVGILISAILIIPTFYVIISGRMPNEIVITLKDLLIPKINVKYLMYNAYGVGLTSFALLGLINLFDNKRENRFLTIVLVLINIFPIFNYLLNGTMYIDSKSLIPFLPLYCLEIAYLFKKCSDGNLNVKRIIICSILIAIYTYLMKSYYDYIFYIDLMISIILLVLFNKNYLRKIVTLVIPVLLVIAMISGSKRDNLFKKSILYHDMNINQEKLSSKISSYDRTAFLNYNLENINNIYGNNNIYQNYIYSSTNNANYNKFFFDTFENVMQSRNRLIVSANKNIMFLMFMNNKYVIGDDINIVGYNHINSIGNTVLYENNDVLPLMYVTNNYYNISDFNKLSFPYTNEVLLKYVVNNEKTNDYKSSIFEADISDFNITNMSDDITINDNVINVAKSNSEMNIDLSSRVKGNILFISFNIEPQSCSIGDLSININGNLNKLTCREWKYYNGNTSFNYVISDTSLDGLNVIFNKGTYKIEDLKLYYLDYTDIKDVNKNVTKVDIDSIKGDKILGHVNVIEDGYLVTSIPYDKGFTIRVDGEVVSYEQVNTAFLGFKISKGNHNIEIEYKSPLRNIGIIVSIIGIILYIIFIRKNDLKGN